MSRPSGGANVGARTSGAPTRSTANVNRSTANVNRNVNRDVDFHGDAGYYHGGRYYGGYGYPLARATAFGVAAGATAAAIGSVAYALPSGCATYYYRAGSPYYNCGGVYYAPQYSGTEINYVVIENPTP